MFELWESSNWIAFGALLVSIIGTLGNLFYLYVRTRKKRTKFKLNDVIVSYEKTEDGYLTILKLLLQNVGDRMGYLFINSLFVEWEKQYSAASIITAIFSDKKGEIIEKKYSSNTSFGDFYKDAAKKRNKKLEYYSYKCFYTGQGGGFTNLESYEWMANANSQITKDFELKSIEKPIFEKAKLFAIGYYYDHKGKLRIFAKSKKLINAPSSNVFNYHKDYGTTTLDEIEEIGRSKRNKKNCHTLKGYYLKLCSKIKLKKK